jgi:drug/metabolite transporter (DMT)-like permease
VTAIVPAGSGLAQGERPSALGFVGVALAVIAAALVGGAPPPGRGSTRATTRVLMISAASGVGLGLANACFAQTAASSGLWPVVVTKIVALLAIVAVAVRDGTRASPRHGRFAVATGFVDASATATISIALQRGSLVLVSVLGSLFPAVTVVLARTFLRERIGPLQAVGIALALIAVALIVAG